MMSDDDEDDYYGDDDDDEGGGLDLGSFLGDEDPDSEDDEFDEESELDDDEQEEKVAIQQMVDSVNREEAREVFELMKAPEDGYPESDLDAFITEWAYEFYDMGKTAIDWSAVS